MKVVRPKEERERRAELQRQRREKRREASAPPPSTPSRTSQGSTPSLPPAPPPKEESAGSMDRVLRLLESLSQKEKEAATTETTKKSPPKSEEKKKLPTDPAKREAALDTTRWLASAPVELIAGFTDALDARPMSERERTNLIEAFAAFIWFYGWDDPRIALLLALAGYGAPRAVDFGRNWRRKRKGLKPLQPWKDKAPELVVDKTA